MHGGWKWVAVKAAPRYCLPPLSAPPHAFFFGPSPCRPPDGGRWGPPIPGPPRPHRFLRYSTAEAPRRSPWTTHTRERNRRCRKKQLCGHRRPAGRPKPHAAHPPDAAISAGGAYRRDRRRHCRRRHHHKRASAAAGDAAPAAVVGRSEPLRTGCRDGSAAARGAGRPQNRPSPLSPFPPPPPPQGANGRRFLGSEVSSPPESLPRRPQRPHRPPPMRPVGPSPAAAVA